EDRIFHANVGKSHKLAAFLTVRESTSLIWNLPVARAPWSHLVNRRRWQRPRGRRASDLPQFRNVCRAGLPFVRRGESGARKRGRPAAEKLCKRRSGSLRRAREEKLFSRLFRWGWKLARKTRASAGHRNLSARLRRRRCANPGKRKD